MDPGTKDDWKKPTKIENSNNKKNQDSETQLHKLFYSPILATDRTRHHSNPPAVNLNN